MLNFSARPEALAALEEAVSRHDSMRGHVTAVSECFSSGVNVLRAW